MSGRAFARQVSLTFSEAELWPQVRARFVAYARADRDRLIAARQFPSNFTTFVNGAEGADETTLRPDGVILYRGQALGLAIAFALDFLARRSPFLDGDYRKSFMVGVSRGAALGRAIPMLQFDPAKVSPDATEAFVYSPLPYSRLVDVQMVGTRRLRFSVEPGLYQDAAKAVRARFPALDARREYTIQHPDRERREDGRWIEYPALLIRQMR
jgi:hypothetical protein